MGLGDVKFAVLGGMIVGLKLLFIWLLLAFLTGGIVGIILILARKAKMKTKIAFGPFLILGLGLALIFGRNIMYLLGLT
jgi:prepilin signal peptidase PulO-like enzyme (type II secretory pathway)